MEIGPLLQIIWPLLICYWGGQLASGTGRRSHTWLLVQHLSEHIQHDSVSTLVFKFQAHSSSLSHPILSLMLKILDLTNFR